MTVQIAGVHFVPRSNTITVTGDGSALDKAGLYIRTYVGTMLLSVQRSDFIHTRLVAQYTVSIHHYLLCQGFMC